MEWIKPEYSKSEINHAGDVLINTDSSEEQINEAREILDNWRAIHAYPMHIFKKRLKDKALLVDKNALTVQRLKRVPAIIKKLQRKYGGRPPTMKLSQIQDIGGCRAVLANVNLAKQLCDKYYLKGDLKHKRVNMKDYIANPKSDGYRSIHLIYRYLSDKGKKEYNSLLVEVQIRSKLQHLWATAIETVDFFTQQAIKSSEGQEEWMEFFRFKVFEQKVKQAPKMRYFLLELDIAGEKLNIASYTKDQERQAIIDYAASEKKNIGKREYDVVLVGADTSNDLQKAYPNYFMDSGEFLANLKKIIDKY